MLAKLRNEDAIPYTVYTLYGIQYTRFLILDTSESDSELEHVRQSQIETEKRKRDLGIAGYYSSKAVFKVSSTAYSFVFQLLKVWNIELWNVIFMIESDLYN